jgi:anaerobic selenocysteine-containing dehydrogenase/Fe-S-cluster-containing dehydrogenase component
MKIVAMAGLAASACGGPAPRELIPYVIPDDDVVPGVPSFFASACRECPAGCGVVVRVREGRAVKLEGNPHDPIDAGSLCARGQAALQGLYNPDRLARPQARVGDGPLAPAAWESGLETLARRLAAADARGTGRVAVVGPDLGPTLEDMLGTWLSLWRSTRRVVHEPLDDGPALRAARLCFDRADLPVHRLDAADVLVSFGADFLETWRSPVELTRQYAAFRAPRPGPGGTRIGWAAYVGPHFGLTAANCDRWLAARPGGESAVALGILHVLAREGPLASGVDRGALQRYTAACAPGAAARRAGVPADAIADLAARVGRAREALFLAGTEDDLTHVATSLLNAATGALGRGVSFLPGAPPAPDPGAFDALVEAMRAGAVDVVMVHDANPVFTRPDFADALARVPYVVWLGQVPDETAASAHLQLPTHHPLERWGDLAPRPGVRFLAQPVMQPVVASLPLGDVLLATMHAAGRTHAGLPWESTRAAVEASWRRLHADRDGAGDFAPFWGRVRRDGGLFEEVASATVTLGSAALAAPARLPDDDEPEPVLVAFPHIFLADGRGADKPWLQEAPEPVTQIVWDTWVAVHPTTAADLGVAAGELVEMRSPGGAIAAPAHVTEHVRPGALAVPFGQGHTSYGRYATGRGANPWRILPPGRRQVAVQARPTGATRALVSPLGLPDMLGRPIVETVALDDLRRGLTPSGEGLPPEPWELRDRIAYPGHKWGMTIDLNACTGCSACVTACYAENNLAVVGKEEVARGHIMSWIRIERFVPRTPDAPPLYLMPMLCQQCDRAPCEDVCPVYASYHTQEGLNGQVYNRCIGTRYCNNNCPYKVRRFNWFHGRWPSPLDLQLNPDVTVRGAGVMEKCTFCIQRIRAAEMDAEAEHRPVRDGEILPACAQTCPAKAITFGDMNAPDSAVMQRRGANAARSYRALGELNTRPAIAYLRQIYRRPDRDA